MGLTLQELPPQEFYCIKFHTLVEHWFIILSILMFSDLKLIVIRITNLINSNKKRRHFPQIQKFCFEKCQRFLKFSLFLLLSHSCISSRLLSTINFWSESSFLFLVTNFMRAAWLVIFAQTSCFTRLFPFSPFEANACAVETLLAPEATAKTIA